MDWFTKRLAEHWDHLTLTDKLDAMRVVILLRMKSRPALAAPKPGTPPSTRRARIWEWVGQKIDYARPIILGRLPNEGGQVDAFFGCLIALGSILILFAAWANGTYSQVFTTYMHGVHAAGLRGFAELTALTGGFFAIWLTPISFIPVFQRMFVREFGILLSSR